MNELGEFIKELRIIKAKSIRKASEEIGISHTYLDSLEKGFDPRTKKERIPTPDVLKKISNYYGVSFIKLMNMSGQLTEDAELVEGNDEINISKILTGVLNGKKLVLGIDTELTQQESMIIAHFINAFSNKLIRRKESLSTDEVNLIMKKFDDILETVED